MVLGVFRIYSEHCGLLAQLASCASLTALVTLIGVFKVITIKRIYKAELFSFLLGCYNSAYD